MTLLAISENLNIDDVNSKILESLKEQIEGEQVVEELEQQGELPRDSERGGAEYEDETPRQTFLTVCVPINGISLVGIR